MRTVWVIFAKEFKDTIRDRRAMVMMVLIPLLIMPAMVSGIIYLQNKIEQQRSPTMLRLGLVSYGNARGLEHLLREQEDVVVVTHFMPNDIPVLLHLDSLDAALVLSEDFDEQLRGMASGVVKLFYQTDADSDATLQRLRSLIDAYRWSMLSNRMGQQGLDGALLEVVQVEEVDMSPEVDGATLSTLQEPLPGLRVAGILSYFFIIFCYLGAMYPAIDLAAGEKERATMETLLTVPATRLQIVLGKFGVIVLTGVASAVIAFVGIYLGLVFMRNMPAEMLVGFQRMLQPGMLLLQLSLLLPLAMFFAALMLTLSILAKSFKEAQSILGPLPLITVLPAVVGLWPGFELNPQTALIPMMNVTLAMRELAAGTHDGWSLALVGLSLMALAGVSLAFCVLIFRREDVIFRT